MYVVPDYLQGEYIMCDDFKDALSVIREILDTMPLGFYFPLVAVKKSRGNRRLIKDIRSMMRIGIDVGLKPERKFKYYFEEVARENGKNDLELRVFRQSGEVYNPGEEVSGEYACMDFGEKLVWRHDNKDI